MAQGGQYVLRDPWSEYALSFMYALHRRYGWRAVVLITDPREYRMNHYRYPQFRDKNFVAATYRFYDQNQDELVEVLRREHNIQAVVPFSEPSVVPMTELAAALGLSWAQPEVMARFRNKYALKRFLGNQNSQLRINATKLVSSSAEALAFVKQLGLSRFVLKPNDGFGNMDVGIFAAGEDDDVRAYWDEVGAPRLLLEEFIGGDEFHCDGQVDAEGNITITDACQYRRGQWGNRSNIEMGSQFLPTTDPRFGQLADYITEVITTSGLRRSPFHAEVKIDENGPCLIECGARLVGLHTAPLVNLLHGGKFDCFDVAAHYYAETTDYGELGLDWNVYNSRLIRQVNGLVAANERVVTLTGVSEVECLPQFLDWLVPIESGQRLHQTNDMFGVAYIAALQGVNDQVLNEAEEQVHQVIQWNYRKATLRETTASYKNLVVRRLKQLPGINELRLPKV